MLRLTSASHWPRPNWRRGFSSPVFAGRGRLLAAAVGDKLLLVAGGQVALTPGLGAAALRNRVHPGEQHLRVQLLRLDRRAGASAGLKNWIESG